MRRSRAMYDVIIYMEGEFFLNGCLIYDGFCPRDSVCPAHFFWKELQKDFRERLEGENFENLAKNTRLLEAAKHKNEVKKEKAITFHSD